MNLTKEQLTEQIDENLCKSYAVSLAEATDKQVYTALAGVVKSQLLAKRKVFNHAFKAEGQKRLHYLSMEFLLGRSLKNNLFNLELAETAKQALAQEGFDIEDIYEQESDAGLGNGGLGRLAACYMDALASQNYPATGHCLLYEYGIFKQKLVDGYQTELPDNWLPGGEVWLTQRPDKAVSVRFKGSVKELWGQDKMTSLYTDYEEVEAMPFDLMISGYQSDAVSVLRLWSARNKHRFDMHAFSQGEYLKALQENAEAEIITKVLYPSDNNLQGKSLRLKQQYFLVSASLQDIVSDYLKRNKNFKDFAGQVAIHINDTHPVLAIPELMRLLLDGQGMEWEEAWEITQKTFSYTNHTVLSEALETWEEQMFQRMLPRIYDIVKEINRRECAKVWQQTGDWKQVSELSVLAYGQVKMANLAVLGSHKVNGVSKLHTEILKKSIFSSFQKTQGDKFVNITNGIALRRWLNQSNPALDNLLKDTVGQGYERDFSRLKEFEKYKEDGGVLQRLEEIKLNNKERFCAFAKKEGIILNPYSRFDCQVKRLHEYKRQLLNALRIIHLYLAFKEGEYKNPLPQTFIFGAKAASGYYNAKEVIRLIYQLGKYIESDKEASQIFKIAFLENYSVTAAEALMPSCEVSQQISLAGKEASGTGNMKFMANGALTCGTLDGANVEIVGAAGKDNAFIFGMDAKEAEELWARGYNSVEYYFAFDNIRRTADFIKKGFGGNDFTVLFNYLLKDNIPDPYMCFADFNSYINAHKLIDEAYADKTRWNKMSLANIANAGIFSADRAVKQYADEIWGLKSQK